MIGYDDEWSAKLKIYVWIIVTQFTIASVSRSMFEYADCEFIRCKHQLPGPFPFVDGSTPYMIRCRYIGLTFVQRSCAC